MGDNSVLKVKSITNKDEFFLDLLRGQPLENGLNQIRKQM